MDLRVDTLAADSGRITGNSDVTRLGKGCRPSRGAAIRVHRQVIGRRTCRWDSVQMITKRRFVKWVWTSTFADRLGYSHGPTNHRDSIGCPTSLRAQNADEVYGSCATRGQQ